jgi:cytochrome c biogenesis protein CcdA
MSFFLLSFFAGILTVLAPCILPFLPLVIGASEPGNRRISRRALIVILSLSISVILFTLLLKATTLLIIIPQLFWNIFSGSIIIVVGLALLFPTLWASIPLIQKLSSASNSSLSKGVNQKNYLGDILIGLALGPVFTTCSPTYLFIIATILPAELYIGVLYLIGFTAGLAFSLLVIAYFGQTLVNKIVKRMGTAGTIKKIFAIIIILVGIAIMTGADKQIETFILDSGYGATIAFEERLIEKFAPRNVAKVEITVPRHLRNAFPNMDWSNADTSIERLLSGGPGKDGIPAIDNPKFVSISEFKGSDQIQAVVLQEGNVTKVYPYNILTWHEIVNDKIGERFVAVTFCPLCGSAIVFNRDLPRGITTFGVSGSLIESNMVMYDRDTESLWQQSTGKGIAGRYLGKELELEPFQLLAISEVKQLFPDAIILSEDTGYRRDYSRNPYADYDESDEFLFTPSDRDKRYNSKEIFVVFRMNEKVVGVPWLSLNDGKIYQTTVDKENITILKENGELKIKNELGQHIPFYFEMWFSFYVQNKENVEVFDPDAV